MDIFNRPPAIAEDTLQYTLHPGPAFPDRSAVTTLATVINSHVSSLLPNHIWHRDAFELKVVKQALVPDQWNIEGRMRVGDCVDDEWCVVWLLRDITQRWDVAVSVFDSDGDFLLIEAAEYLPAWITPTNSENRLWIYKGRLHLVPLQYVSPSTTKPERRMPVGAGSDDEQDEQETIDYISVSDAVVVVRDAKIDTLANPDVEKAAFRRIEGYPDLARQHLHRTKAFIPRDIAIALSNNPSLVQKATEAFYTRDALQLRAATRMTRFPPDSSILATVTMTRTAYAQLMGQKFHPPKAFGQWKEREGTSEWKWRDIGMKIACGFEMVYQETKSRHGTTAKIVDDGEVSIQASKEALQRDPEYHKYIQNLQKVGFFKGEIEGSAFWGDQETRAAAQFIQARQTDNANRPSFASLVNAAISKTKTQINKNNSSDLAGGDEDSDDWLIVDESTLNNMLSSFPETSSAAQGGNDMDVDQEDHAGGSAEIDAAEQASQLRSLASKVEKFVEGEGDVEGATFEDDLLSDEADMSELSDSDDESASGSHANSTIDVAAAERQAAMDNLVPALQPSEYGTMPPSFHSNSQRVKEVSLESQEQVEESQKSDVSLQLKPMRPLLFPRDQFDGVEDSDDESEDEGVGGGDEEEEDEDRPMVVGELEIDMQEEEEEFLEFSREALGISPEMWNDIVKDRQGRGAFLPQSASHEATQHSQMSAPLEPLPVDSRPQKPDSEVSPNGNPNLDSFEAVMQAMDAELSRAKQGKQAAKPKATRFASQPEENPKNKGKQKADDGDEDVATAMDAELRAALQDSSDDEDQEDEVPMDYTLMKNFLESFKSQQGLPGPVSNLVGRLGWQLPRDES